MSKLRFELMALLLCVISGLSLAQASVSPCLQDMPTGVSDHIFSFLDAPGKLEARCSSMVIYELVVHQRRNNKNLIQLPLPELRGRFDSVYANKANIINFLSAILNSNRTNEHKIDAMNKVFQKIIEVIENDLFKEKITADQKIMKANQVLALTMLSFRWSYVNVGLSDLITRLVEQVETQVSRSQRNLRAKQARDRKKKQQQRNAQQIQSEALAKRIETEKLKIEIGNQVYSQVLSKVNTQLGNVVRENVLQSIEQEQALIGGSQIWNRLWEERRYKVEEFYDLKAWEKELDNQFKIKEDYRNESIRKNLSRRLEPFFHCFFLSCLIHAYTLDNSFLSTIAATTEFDNTKFLPKRQQALRVFIQNQLDELPQMPINVPIRQQLKNMLEVLAI